MSDGLGTTGQEYGPQIVAAKMTSVYASGVHPHLGKEFTGGWLRTNATRCRGSKRCTLSQTFSDA